MPESPDSLEHVRPFVCSDLTTKSLHFSIADIQSRMRLQEPHALDVEYTRLMMGFLLFNTKPTSIAMIGLGGGSLAKFCRRYLPDARITVIEINPHVIALREEFHVPKDSAGFRVIQADGSRFVRETDDRFDVMLIDAFDYHGLPARLCSRRFYDDCRDSLSPEGILVVNAHAGDSRLDAIIARIEASFCCPALRVETQRYGNCVVFAPKGAPLETQHRGLAGRPRAMDESAWSQLKPAFARIVTSLLKVDA